MAAPSASSSGDLLDLVQVGQGASTTTIYPTPDNVLSTLQARFRSDLPYTRIGSHHLVVVNPYKTLASANDASMKEYEEKGWRDTAAGGVVGGRMQPHVYETAVKMYYAMRRKKEAQGAISRGLTSSGKSTTFRLLTNELLSLSSHTRKETSLASQVKHTLTILDAFGNSKSPWNDNAPACTLLIPSFHPLERPNRRCQLRAEERTFHIFYQFLNGATAEERDYFGLEDMSDYKLLSSSGCYRLSSATGMFLSPDDSIGMVETRASLAALGFKPKHLSSIFTLLTSILLLGNLEFAYQDEGVAQRSSQAYVTNPTVLAQAARLLGVGEEELSAVLTTRMRWIRKESVGVLLDDEQSAAQRDRCMRDLYAVLLPISSNLATIVSPPPFPSQRRLLQQPPRSTCFRKLPIFMLDQPGYQTRTFNRTSMGTAPLVGSPYGSNSYEEFTINFADEVVNSFISQHSFEPSVGFNSILTNENLLRGNPSIEPTPVSASGKKLGGVLGVIARASHNWKTGKSGLIDESKGEAVDKKDGEIIDGVLEAFGDRCKGLFGVDESTVGLLGGSPGSGSRIKTTFFINHFSSPHPTTYSVANFVEKDADLLDVSFLTLLRGSRDGFVSRLVSGPGVATERHARDDNLVVQSQVLGRGLRDVTPVLSGETYARIAEAKGKTSSGSDSSTAPAASSGPLGGLLTIAEDELTKVYEGRPGRMDPSKTYSLLAQVNQSVSEVLWAFGKVVNPPSLHLAAGGASPFEAPVLPEVGSELDSPGSIIKSAGNRLFTITHIRPNDSISPNSFDKRRVRLQLAAFAIPSLVQRLHRNDWSVAIDRNVFVERYVGRMRGSVNERMTQISRAEGWTIGKDAWWRDSSTSTSFDGESEDNVFGEGAVKEEGHVFLTYDTWKSVEDRVRAAEKDGKGGPAGYGGYEGDEDELGTEYTHGGPGEGQMLLGVPAGYAGGFGGSNDNLLGQGGAGMSMPDAATYGPGGLTSPGLAPAYPGSPSVSERGGGDRGFPPKDSNNLPSGDMKVKEAPNAVEQIPSTRTRKWWLRTVWACTWLIPSFLLSSVGRMKRPDVRLAWREKVTIFWLIFLFNGIVIFYIVVFGRLLCPEYDKAWTLDEVAGHQGDNDIFIAVRGVVRCESNDRDTIEQLAGADMTYYFPPPLPLACPFLVADDANIQLEYKNFTPPVPQAIHTSGSNGATDDLKDPEWYRIGPVVWDRNKIRAWAEDEGMQKIWGVYNNRVYDLTDYDFTLERNNNQGVYAFLDEDIVDTFRRLTGKDLTKDLQQVFDRMEDGPRRVNLNCLENAFFVGEADFRKTARCQASNYLLIIASVILMSSMGLKFLAALQLGGKRNPELQDKFVLCQVPCYTEGEDSLRRTIDSLAALKYDDKRKLIFIICDGNIIGSGNDRTTPRIVLDILGVDPKVDPEPLLFKSIGEGSKALNYGKIYSGPLSGPGLGNRGKRDSQILLMQYLNRVHFDSPMNPLELEIYHQMRNVIGIDPAFYEYIFTIDADTTVTGDSLNRLVASSADDSAIIGICGETKLSNEEVSWWTMIQVYEYYISHHLSKAFESLFGSVTCLPGCFSLYRIRTADKGRPIIISNRIIEEYAEPNVDTLHKKNLFSLGEDRFLTTLLMKHFPSFKTKFCPDAIAHTMAPESWKVLFSQRRRWINSTVHNLCELLVYLIVVVATQASAFPRIAIIMLAVVYGLQAFIFIIKREFMLIGWMVVYILSYPVYSFFLPVYSFWCMDEFSWGNTRVVVGEGKEKKVIVNDDEKFDESIIPLKKFSEYEAEAWETGSRRSDDTGYNSQARSKPRDYSRSRPPSPHGSQYHSSHAGDYYRDTNPLDSKSNLKMPLGNGSQHSGFSHGGFQGMQPMSTYGAPQLPFVSPFGGGGSMHGSDYGGPTASMGGGMMSGIMYGAPQMMTGGSGPRNTMMSMGFGGGASGMGGSFEGGMNPPPALGASRPMSTFSMATTVNPFAGPSMNANPSDEELFGALRNYLSTQDLMTVTKKTTREAIQAKFPKADLASKKEFLNTSIDKILSES
ncbi:chitin synthase 6 [Coprinopsis sp. MPI-PUGE-AT-0042]|nr:chitin synthase 6 [Coprinopsis sp. MPI-PUGE-AT-0042]